jgi:ApbE superfamily uncharacterized protein (UPF0280 family)
MDPAALLEQMKKAAQDQIELNKKTLDNNLDAADRIHARQASESIVRSTIELMDHIRQNPQQPATSP